MPHWRKRYHIEQSGWIETGTAAVLGWLGMLFYCGILGLFIYAMFATIPRARAATACQPNQIEGLSELARDLGVKASQAPTISTGIGCDGKAYDFITLLRAHVKLVRDKK